VTKKRKKIIFSCVLLVLVLLVVEAISYYGLQVIDRKNQLATLYSLIPPDVEKATLYDDFIASNQADVNLGWDEKSVIRGRPQMQPGEKCFASAYGDSMTYSDEVEYEQSWPYLLECRTGREFLNLGVPGYGTDQSYLKFVECHEDYPAEYVILGILPDDINRLLLVVPNYRWRNTPIVTKPRYVVTPKGIELLKNPLERRQDYYRLLDPEFLSRISQNDECFTYYRRRYGFDFVYGRRFPFTLGLAKAVVGQFRYGLAERCWGPPRALYEEGSDSLRLMNHVVDEFQRKCVEFGCTPIVMMHCDAREDITEYEYLQPFIEGIRRRGIMAVNIRDVFVIELASGKAELPELLAAGGHYSFFANQIIARKLEMFFTLLGEGKISEAATRYEESLHAEVDYCEVHLKAGLAFACGGEESQKNLHAAMYHCQKAVQLDPRNPDAHFALGTVARSIGNSDGARGCFHKVLELRPNHIEAKEALDTLSGAQDCPTGISGPCLE